LTPFVEELWKLHRKRFRLQRKACGFDFLDARYGVIISRLKSLGYRLEAHIRKEPEALRIPEFDARLDAFGERWDPNRQNNQAGPAHQGVRSVHNQAALFGEADGVFEPCGAGPRASFIWEEAPARP